MTPAMIIAAINGAIDLIGLLLKGAQAMKQDKEWTAAEDKAYSDAVERLSDKDAWKIID